MAAVTIEVLNKYCMVCHAQTRLGAPAMGVLSLVVFMKGNELTIDDVISGMCFAHRRQATEAIEECKRGDHA